MASFGPKRHSQCGQKPGGFTRLTPEVLNWVKTVTGMEYHPGISDPGEMLIVHLFSSFPFIDLIISAVLITGGFGASVEIYHPDQNTSCVLHDLPDWRDDHTQDRELLCGGGWRGTRRSCLRWNSDTGAWDLVSESLKEKRQYHTSWTPSDGSVTYLMGGGYHRTSEIIDKDNGVTSSFPLQHKTE